MEEQRDSALESQLRAVEQEKHGSYDKRTHHLNDDGTGIFINRLILENSPYLLQHAHNPVNWFPWGSEAFEIAEQENKPIFLSIGYSTCHWCHVMEVESFDNVEVAKLLNQHFISIKMDREQFPDIDDFYMTGVQIMTGQGGWPMSNFLLPNGKPFFGATYFPPPSFLQLLDQVASAWSNKFDELENSANSIYDAIERLLNAKQQREGMPANLHETVLEALYQREDRSLGGLAGAPKFPQEPLLMLALDRVLVKRDQAAWGFLDRALSGMNLGGIHDQVGGGFHRYAVDEEWLVPHFEKMLYNQSQLGWLYVEAYRLSGNETHKRVAHRLLSYVVREMQLEEGGFYSATDADSEGAEGTFFLWSPDQLAEVLTEEESNLISKTFKITSFGNFEGSNIPNLDKPVEALTETHGADIVETIDQILEKLYLAREQRIHPIRDDKLIVAWCAAMANTLAHGSYVMGNVEWHGAAQQAIDGMLERNLDSEGHLSRIYLEGEVSIPAQLEDYANLIEALITLFDIGSETKYLQVAHDLMSNVLAGFYDDSDALFFLGPEDQVGPTLVRSTNASDGATHSAAGTILRALWKLRNRSALLSDPGDLNKFEQTANQSLAALGGELAENALSHSGVLRAISLVSSGENSPIQYAGLGRVRIAIHKQQHAGMTLTINLRCQEGWHVSAPGGDADGVVPLKVKVSTAEPVWKLDAVDYPQAHKELTIGIEGQPVFTTPSYFGEIEFTATFVAPIAGDGLTESIRCDVKLQVCSDKECLLPETLQFVV